MQPISLPIGWKLTTLGETFKWGSGGTPLKSKTAYYSNGDIPWAIIGDLNDGVVTETQTKISQSGLENSSAKWVEKGSVLIAMYGSIGKLGIAGTRMTTNQAIAFTRPDPINNKYLFYYLMGERDNLLNLGMGATQQNISQTIIKAYPFPLAPIPEQERIVERIESLFTQLDAGVADLKRVQAALKRCKASVLKAACEGRLVPQDRSDEPAEVMLKRFGKPPLVSDGLSDLPNGWSWVTVGDVSTSRLGKMLDKVKNIGELQPYLRNINVRWFGFDLSDIQYMRVMNNELDNVSVRKGDLVVCEGGEPGRAAVWNSEETFIIQKALHRVRPFEGLLPTYLSFCIASDANSGRLERYFTGSTIKHFTGQSLGTYTFPLPPLNEQHRIAIEVEQRFSVIHEVEKTIASNLKRAGRLRQAILKRAFQGRLS